MTSFRVDISASITLLKLMLAVKYLCFPGRDSGFKFRNFIYSDIHAILSPNCLNIYRYNFVSDECFICLSKIDITLMRKF